MSRMFHPGMKVRYVGGHNQNNNFLWPVGVTGVLKAYHPHHLPGPYNTSEPHWEWVVDTPAPGHPAFGRQAFSPPYHLEPIIDPPQLSSWESMGFHPEQFLDAPAPVKAPEKEKVKVTPS